MAIKPNPTTCQFSEQEGAAQPKFYIEKSAQARTRSKERNYSNEKSTPESN